MHGDEIQVCIISLDVKKRGTHVSTYRTTHIRNSHSLPNLQTEQHGVVGTNLSEDEGRDSAQLTRAHFRPRLSTDSKSEIDSYLLRPLVISNSDDLLGTFIV